MDESIRSMLLDAMRWEDAKLQSFLDKNRLEEWYFTTLEAARNTVKYKLREAEGALVTGEKSGNGAARTPESPDGSDDISS